ncbi:hypothetical protein ACVW0P_001809 [Mucilaginibacter sp. UYNi724]
MNKHLKTVIKEKFKFLEKEFDFELTKSKRESWGFESLYINATTAVKISYETRESYLFIMLYKLVNGDFIENPVMIKISTDLYGYGLDDILLIKDPSALLLPMYKYADGTPYQNRDYGLSIYINDFAVNLKKFAGDILKGDFEIFPKLDKVVKERLLANNDK